MSKLSSALLLCMLMAAESQASRFEYIPLVNGRPLASPAEVCFFKEAPSGMHPGETSFFSNDVRCLPTDKYLEQPPGRFYFFVRSEGLISPNREAFASSGTQPVEAFKRIAVALVPSATLDLSNVHLEPGQSIAVLAASNPHARGPIYPVPSKTTSIDVPAGVPVLPLIIANRAPVRIGDPVTITAGGRAQPTFSNIPGRGAVVTWIEFDSALEHQEQYETTKLGELATRLTASDGTKIAPVFSIAHPSAANGELQIFQNVPPGAATIHVDGERWQDEWVIAPAVAGNVVMTSEPLFAIPAGVINARFFLPGGPVPPIVAVTQSCKGFDPVVPVKFTAYRCATTVVDIAKADLSSCSPVTKEVPLSDRPETRFSRLPTGRYIIEAAHPTLGRARKEFDVLPNTEATLDLPSRAFPIFGRITRRQEPVRAEVRFLEGSNYPGTIVTRDDGRFQGILPIPPGDATVDIVACDESFEYRYNPNGPIPPNVAVDIEVPGSAIEVRVLDDASGDAISDAVVYARELPADADAGPRNQLRAVANKEGVAQFSAVEPSTGEEVCAWAPPQGYIKRQCAPKFEVRKNEVKKVDLKITKEGVIRGKLSTSEQFEPAILFLATGPGTVKERITVGDDGTFWLRQFPMPGDYFALTGPGRPLHVLTTWSTEGKELTLTVPHQRVRSVTIRGSNPDARRLIAVSIAGRRVPDAVLAFHLMNARIDPFSTWTAGRTIPLIAESGPIAITLGPPQNDYVTQSSGAGVFDRPEFANTLLTRVVPPDKDEVVFP